jgi:molybdopterin-guanine dinucleotide biosynthesis protein A
VLPGVILAGGRSRRMGRDKAFVELGGQRLIDRVAARLAPQCAALAVSAADPAAFAGLGLPVLADPVPGYAGPLAGVLAALDWAAARGDGVVATAPVDTPFLSPDLVARLAAAATAGRPAVAADAAGGWHPALAVWPVGLRAALAAALAAGQRRAADFARAQGAVAVTFAAGSLANLNTPADLAAAEARLR